MHKNINSIIKNLTLIQSASLIDPFQFALRVSAGYEIIAMPEK
jgi:hypothetical protein